MIRSLREGFFFEKLNQMPDILRFIVITIYKSMKMYELTVA